MIVFKTNRLIIKTLEQSNINDFSALLTDSNILKLIPQKPFSPTEIAQRFKDNLNLSPEDFKTKKCVCGIFKKNSMEMIGLSLFLINENNDKELGYRFKAPYWGHGYGSETAKAMIDYYFYTLNESKVFADVNTKNIASLKILSKFMLPVKEFFNPRDNCTDRRFEIRINQWIN